MKVSNCVVDLPLPPAPHAHESTLRSYVAQKLGTAEDLPGGVKVFRIRSILSAPFTDQGISSSSASFATERRHLPPKSFRVLIFDCTYEYWWSIFATTFEILGTRVHSTDFLPAYRVVTEHLAIEWAQ